MERKMKKVDNMAANNMDNGFYGQDIISVSQFDRTKLDYILNVANEMKVVVERFGGADLLQGKILSNLFYEPSTRTSSSFMAAMLRLGGQVIPINNVQYSSVTKGESLPDTVRTLESYSDVIVIRHPDVGSAATAWASTPRRRCSTSTRSSRGWARSAGSKWPWSAISSSAARCTA